MKKILSLVLALCMMLCMASVAMAEETYELALVTDIGTIDDKSFNQGSWEGLVQYATENNITHKYYQPAEKSTDAYLDSIALAVEGGAKVIVTPGYLFAEPIYLAQDMYPDVHFILIDGTPASADGDTRTNANVAPVIYAEQAVGYLAGYAAVKEGYTKLGFMGGMAVPAVVKYGYGFVQGAEDAAKELGLAEISLNYHYTGNFDATPENQAMAAAWYNDGVEIIFACGGAVGNSVMAAAEAANGKVIGVDVDQSSESETVVISALKGLSASVYQILTAYYEGSFPGGETILMDHTNNGVSLSMASSKLVNFTQADYDALFAKLGEISIPDDTTAASADLLNTEIVKVTVIG